MKDDLEQYAIDQATIKYLLKWMANLHKGAIMRAGHIMITTGDRESGRELLDAVRTGRKISQEEATRKDVTAPEVVELCKQVRALYRDAGYTPSFAKLPLGLEEDWIGEDDEEYEIDGNR